MLGLVSFFLFAGYTLVYAAVADGGRFAATPWESLRKDAYTGETPAGAAASSQHESTWDALIGSPGHRGALGNWITGIVNAPPAQHPADPSAQVHREIR